MLTLRMAVMAGCLFAASIAMGQSKALLDEYQQRLSKIDAQNPQDHYDLANWAFGKGMLKIARKELKDALSIKDDYEMASLLLRQVEAKLEAAGESGDEEDQGMIAGNVDPNWLLKQQEIYRIRLAELRPTDRVSVNLRNKLVERFIDLMNGQGDFKTVGFDRTFRTWSGVQKVLYILDHVNRDAFEIKDDIEIRTDPEFMMEFRSHVWPIVSSFCGSPHCHGGDKPVGGLRLFTIAGRRDAVDYTNYLILDSYAKGGRKMINRDHIEDSLLLQFGLPYEQARFHHPELPAAARPPYPDRGSANYRRVTAWIESLNGPPHPDYRVELRTPWSPKESPLILTSQESAASQPTTAPKAATPPR